MIFRTVCRALLAQTDADKPPEHWECGSECAECESEREEFEKYLKADLTENTCEKWRQYNFNELQNSVFYILEAEQTNSENWSVKTKLMVNILKSERARLARINEWNKRTAQPPN